MTKAKSIEPETAIFNDTVHYRVIYNSIMYQTAKATKFHLKAKQTINGDKVTGQNNEVWIPDQMFLNPATRSYSEKGFYIWVKKEFYDKMRFVSC